MSGSQGTTGGATTHKKTFWEQIPPLVKKIIYAVGGLIFIFIVFCVIRFYKSNPKMSTVNQKIETTLPQTRTIRVSDYLTGKVKYASVPITEEILLDQDVPYSSVTNVGNIFCDGTLMKTQSEWPNGYQRYRTVKPQSGTIQLILEKP